MDSPHGAFRSFFEGLALTALAALLFAASFPNPVFENGIALLAWVAYVPVFLLVYRTSLGSSVLWGALYGYSAYLLLNYWLANFHQLAGIVVYSIYMVYMAALFFALRLAVVFFGQKAYIAHWVIWLGYEYLRTTGFLGYPYGITGYSQWRMTAVIQIADIFGVYGVSALVVFPSAWIAAAFGRQTENGTVLQAGTKPPFAGCFRQAACILAAFFRREKIPAIAWFAALVAALLYGLAAKTDFSSAPHANIALIQQNGNSWHGDVEEYRRDLEILTRLSDQALAADPKPDMVVWPETAFVPRIYWHLTYRDPGYRETWQVVKELLDYLEKQDVPFVIGNDDARMDPVLNRNEDFLVRYNAALLFRGREIAGIYRKMHLVPFTEHFPFEKQLPFVYRFLLDADTNFWQPGTEATVFSGPGFRFSTPICFEDSFGDISRKFVQNGAGFLVNLTNDAWAKSLSSQNQHLAMAVFRAVENRRSMVRATASGQTCGILPDGSIAAMAPPFSQVWLNVSLPVVKDRFTVYTRIGDLAGKAFAVAAVVLLIVGAVLCIIRNAHGSSARASGILSVADSKSRPPSGKGGKEGKHGRPK